MVVELVGGMNDYRLKPRMLRTVVRDRLPDEKLPFPSPSDLASVLSHVRAHGLLSEQLPDTAEHKLAEAWRAAVDSWVERIVSLASSNAPDKRWAGICFLGLTCEECCSVRFQSSYTIWFQSLLENIQTPSNTHIAKAACCASMNDLFTRLSCLPNLKKDGTLFSGKLVLPVLQLLNEDAGETIWEVAVNLLCTLSSFFPSFMQRHYDNVEAVFTSKIMAAKYDFTTSKKFAKGLALLPKVKGDEDSWCSVIQKILIAINAILTDAFQGLEEEKKSFEVMKMIVPSGNEAPPPLGGQTLLQEASEPATKRIRELLVPRVTTLMCSLCIMLTNPHPLPVSIPVRSLLATVWRVLQVDGSFPESSFPLTTSLHQELLCAALPALHLGSLDLLIAIIKSLRSQLLPHGPNLVRLLIEYFQRARLPSIRTKIYSIMQMLLISMGVGMALYLAQEVINNVFSDLTDYLGHGNNSMHLNKQSSIVACETVQQSLRRKRKRATLMPSEDPNEADLSNKTTNRKSEAPFSVQIAALKALEALLTVGGSLRSEKWRPNVDFLVITVATNACNAGWANEDKISVPSDESCSLADFQFAALEVLLVSLLSPTQSRPPYLSQGLDLLHRGRQETGSKIAVFCAKALLALEVLIHPRALPLEDQPPRIKSNLPSFSKGDLVLLDEDEDLSSSWSYENDEQISMDGRNRNDEHAETTTQPSKHNEDIIEVPSTANADRSPVLDFQNKVSQSVDEDMECLDRDENMIDIEKREEPWSRNEITNNVSDNKLDSGRGVLPFSRNEMSPGKSDSPLGANLSNCGSDTPNLTTEEDVALKRASDFNKIKVSKPSYDSDFSLDSFPDIVDADPDSDCSI